MNNKNIVFEEDDERRKRRRRRRRDEQQPEENVFLQNGKQAAAWTSETATTTINDTVPSSSLPQEESDITASTTTTTTLVESQAQPTSVSSSSLDDDDDSHSNSHILRINAETRLAHLTAILPLTTWNSIDHDIQRRELVDFRVYLQISVFLAWHHLQHPNNNNIILPEIAARLQSCDLQFSLQLHDSQFSPLHAARQLVNVLVKTKAQVIESPLSIPATTRARRRRAAEAEARNGVFHSPNALLEISPMPPGKEDGNNSTSRIFEAPPAQRIISLLPPMAIMGAARSAVTATLSDLSSVYGIPQISGSSTASILDDKSRHPLLARTVPTNAGDARAAVLYLQHLATTTTATGGATAAAGIQHLAVLYIGDDFGTNYHAAIVREASIRHVSIRSIQYTTEQSMDSALQQLQESGMRYVLAILNPKSWKQLLARAAVLDLAGPGTGYTWFLTEANLEVANPEFALTTRNNPQDALVARALHGAGVVLIHIPDHPGLDQALQDFRNDAVLQHDFASLYRDDDETKMLLLQNFTYPPVGRSFYQYLYYDAIMALGIAACETTSRDLFTGQELYQQLLQTEFQGVSGTVSFDPLTGTRRAQNFQFRIVNLMRKDNNNDDIDDDGMVRFQTQIVALVHPPPIDDYSNATGMGSSSTTNTNEIVEWLAPFVYADSTTRVPADLSPLVEDLNLITPAYRGVGLTLGLLAMISSIGWMIWTLCHRKKDVVQSSQPFFLVQLCIGTLVMSSAIIPLSLQEPVRERVLDMCCMMVPWLISLGFVTSFSALFSKTWRLRRLYAAGRRCQRITLAPKDVILPFIALLTLNVALLVAWTIVAPLTWERVALDNYDEHGRAVESVGSCRANDDLETQVLPFAILILALNVVALVFATYQAYLARDIPTEFFEAGYVFMSFASLLETFIIGAPLLFIASTDPNACFLIRSILITISCLAIQLPVFVPKYNKRKTVLQERLHGSGTTDSSSVNVFIDGRRVNILALSLQGQAGGSIKRSWRNLFGTPDRGEATTETSAMSSEIVGRSHIRRTPKFYKEEELKRRRLERSRSSSSVGATGSLCRKPVSLSTLVEAREQVLSRSQTDRPEPISSPPQAMKRQDSKRSVTSKTSEVDHSGNSQ